VNTEDIVREALFEVRPYVEDYEKLKATVNNVLGSGGSESLERLKEILKLKIKDESEPFKTDLKILLQKIEAMGDKL